MTRDSEKNQGQTPPSLNSALVREVQQEICVKKDESISQLEDLSQEDHSMKRMLVR